MDGLEIRTDRLHMGSHSSKARVKPGMGALLLLSLAVSACASGLGRSVIALPPSPGVSAAVAAPALVVRLDFVNPGLKSFGEHVADYLSDGTVIRLSGHPLVPLQYGDHPGTLEINKLTAAGMASLHALLAEDADLLGQPNDIKEQLLPGKSVTGRGYLVDRFVLPRLDGSRYTVTVPSLTSTEASFWAPDPRITRLSALGEALADPTTTVGAAGLASPVWTTYQPAQAALFVRSEQLTSAAFASMVAQDLWPTMDPSHWPFASPPGTFGSTFAGPYGLEQCTFLPTADALTGFLAVPAGPGPSLAASELGAGNETGSELMLWNAQNLMEDFSLDMAVLLPEDAVATCLEALSY